MLAEDELKDAKLLVFANKMVRISLQRVLTVQLPTNGVLLCAQDQPNALPEAQVIEGLGLDTLKERQWTIVRSCAITGEGLEAGLDWCVVNFRRAAYPLFQQLIWLHRLVTAVESS